MKLAELFEKVENSSDFKKFKKQNKDAYFCIGFFVVDYESNETKRQLDYFVDEGNIMTFLVNDKIASKKAEMAGKETLNEIKKSEIKVDVDEAFEIAKKELEKLKLKPTKIIAILQRLKDKDILMWNITCVSGFSLLRMHVNMEKEIILNQKTSLMDLMRIERGNKDKGTNYVG